MQVCKLISSSPHHIGALGYYKCCQSLEAKSLIHTRWFCFPPYLFRISSICYSLIPQEDMVHLSCKSPGGMAINTHCYSEDLPKKRINCSGARAGPHSSMGESAAESLRAYFPSVVVILMYSHQDLGQKLKMVQCSCGMAGAGNCT